MRTWRRCELDSREENTDIQKAMDSLDHDSFTDETLDIGDGVTRKLQSQKQQKDTVPQYPTVPSPEPVQSQQEIEREVVKKTTNNQLLIIALVVCMVLMVVHSWNTVQTTQNE